MERFDIAADQLEQQIGLAEGNGEITAHMNTRTSGAVRRAQASAQRGIAIEGGELPSNWQAVLNSTVGQVIA